MKDYIQLKHIEEWPKAYDAIEKRLRKFFLDQIYIPILKELKISKKFIQNTLDQSPLLEAISSGKIVYSKGRFSGSFDASTSKELKELGAIFDQRSGVFKLNESKIPSDIKAIISSSSVKFKEKMAELDRKLSRIIPEEMSKEFKCADIFDETLWRADRDFKKNIKKITISPELTPGQRAHISKEWEENTRLYIKQWTQDQIGELRSKIREDVLSGARRESFTPPILRVTQTLQKSHEQAINKAKFLAHQETRLMMASFKESRYTSAGIDEYVWRCVHRPHDSSPDQHTKGNVRYSHGKLDGKTFRFDDPPITSEPGEPVRRNNPGRDYWCRCFARPIVRKST